MQTMTRTQIALLALAGVAAFIAPFIFYPLFLTKVLCYALFASAFNLLLGSCGLLSFGHAAYFGAAAYIVGHVAKVWGLPFEISIVLGVFVAAVLGVVFGYLAIRRQGIYFAMITLALAQMIYFLAVQLPFTGKEDGLTSIPRGQVLGLFDLDNLTVLYFTTLAIFIAALLLIQRIIHSPFGQILHAIRDNEPRMISLGYETNRYKLQAFVLSAAIAGLAGANKAIAFKLATLTDVHWTTSGSVILMTLLGGLGTLLGPFVGALITVTLENYLADSGLPIQAVIGAIFILCILLFRRGVVGEARVWLERWTHQSAEKNSA